VLVVVIVGVIIAVLTARAIRGGAKPATVRAPAHREARPADAIDWGASPELPDQPEDERVLPRLRSAAQLGTLLVVLGVSAAALVGITVLIAARALDRALG
jgi:hypothetical protein